MSPTLSDLRNHEFKPHLEGRQAALFAYFVGKLVVKAPVEYAMYEDGDYDCVFRWREQDRNCYQAVQLKEVVPTHLNPKAEIRFELAKLAKYARSENTVVAFHLNQTGPLDFSHLSRPDIAFSGLWFYGALSPNQSRWLLYGDLLKEPIAHEIDYPT